MKRLSLLITILFSFYSSNLLAGIIIYSPDPIVITSGNIVAKNNEVNLESLRFSDRYEIPLIGEFDDDQDRVVIASEKSVVIANGATFDAEGDILISGNTNQSEKIKKVLLHLHTSLIKGHKVSIHSLGNIETTNKISIDPNDGSVAIAGKLNSNGNIHIQRMTISDSIIEQLKD